jgi:nucleoside-diphosphate-sugar epimerase
MDAYAVSKNEAEKLLLELGRGSEMEVVIVRPPLVYGPGVGGNFKRLMQFVQRGIPLPLASIHNARSMISVQNLADFLIRCLVHPKAAGETFLVADGIDWSTPELIRAIAREMNVRARLFPFPLQLLQLLARISGQAEVVKRLSDSLVVDISKAREYLDWTPPQSPEDALQETVAWYLRNRHA